MNFDYGLEKLIGCTVKAVSWVDGCIYLETTGGNFVLEPYGDCCAHCYVQHISGTDALAPGAQINAVEDIELPPVSQSGYEVSDVWGHRIITSKGYCSIEMRVDHNGYYGGSLDINEIGEPIPAGSWDDF